MRSIIASSSPSPIVPPAVGANANLLIIPALTTDRFPRLSAGRQARYIQLDITPGQPGPGGWRVNETSRKLAVNLFQRPTFGPVSLDGDALAHALQFNQRMADALQAPDASQRKRIWELSGNLHCSIIGTCFSTAELRQLL